MDKTAARSRRLPGDNSLFRRRISAGKPKKVNENEAKYDPVSVMPEENHERLF
jgi:hypothetical protein